MLHSVEALAFDVFGTAVDWRSSVIREGRALGRRKQLDVDWEAFADAWRGGYRPAMDVAFGTGQSLGRRSTDCTG